jgi:hypothetical protein
VDFGDHSSRAGFATSAAENGELLYELELGKGNVDGSITRWVSELVGNAAVGRGRRSSRESAPCPSIEVMSNRPTSGAKRPGLGMVADLLERGLLNRSIYRLQRRK